MAKRQAVIGVARQSAALKCVISLILRLFIQRQTGKIIMIIIIIDVSIPVDTAVREKDEEKRDQALLECSKKGAGILKEMLRWLPVVL